MARQKLRPDVIVKLRAALEAWNPHDPNSPSATELAAQFGISKQTMYTYRRRWLEEAADAHKADYDRRLRVVEYRLEVLHERVRDIEATERRSQQRKR